MYSRLSGFCCSESPITFHKLCFLLLFALASCASPQVTSKPDVAPVRSSTVEARKAIVSTKEHVEASHKGILEGQEALREVDSLLTKLVPNLKPENKEEGLQLKDKISAVASALERSKAENELAWEFVAKAQDKTDETLTRIEPLEKAIKTSHKNEVELAQKLTKYEAFWTSGHKWFGLGAIALGVGLILKHLFIGLAILVVLGILLAIFFPAVLPILRTTFGAAWSWIRRK